MRSASGGGVDVPGELECIANQVADGGEHGGRIAGPDLGLVLAEDDITHSVDGALHGPVPASPGGHLGGGCLLSGQVGGGVDGLAGPLLRPVQAASALDAQDLADVREEQAVDGDDLHQALLVAAVAAGVVTVDHGDLFPGQPVELAGLTTLVVLDCEEVVGAAFVQVGGVGVLGVESVGGDDRPGEVHVVDLVEQGLELGDLVRLRADLTRGQGDAVAVADRGEYEDPAAARASCTAQAFAVHRDHPAPTAHRTGLGGSPVGTAPFALWAAVGHQRRNAHSRTR